MARGRPSKKQHIVETALRLFSRLGYQGTSIDKVVVEAAVSKPTVYSNFSSKQILWTHSLEHVLRLSEEALSKEIFMADDALLSESFLMNDSITNKVINAWLKVWSCWLADDNRLAVYRIMLGESHKMDEQSFGFFQDLEALLVKHLTHVVEPLGVSKEQIYLLMAISKEALLMPLLYGVHSFGDTQYGNQIKTKQEMHTLLNTLLNIEKK